MSNFVSYLSSVAPLSNLTKSDLQDCLVQFEFGRSDTILKQGQVCNYLYFVDRGLLRLFYYREGKEVVDYFATEQNIIGGIASFFLRKPTERIIEALEKSTLTGISFADLEELYSKHHDLEKVGRLLSIGAFLSMQKRLYAIQFYTATQRYEDLIKQNPDILQRVSLGHIASYLGITQVTLSRIRSQK